MRIVWLICGILSVVVGVIGIFLPLLPTVPFLLLAAFCFSRSSERLHHWLLTHPRFGPPIMDWQRSGAISRRAKHFATITISLAPPIAWLIGVPLWAVLLQAAFLIGVLVFIWTRPEG